MLDKFFRKAAKIAHKEISKQAGDYYHAIFDGIEKTVFVSTPDGISFKASFEECGLDFTSIPNLTSVLIDTFEQSQTMNYKMFSHTKVIADFTWELSKIKS
mgnify:CR=1 FL=1